LKILRFVDLEDATDRVVRMKGIIQSQLPPQNLKIVQYLFSFLSQVSQRSTVNKMTPANLGICWGPTLFRTGSQGTGIVQTLIKEYNYIFKVISYYISLIFAGNLIEN
jgi:hypothetical protein